MPHIAQIGYRKKMFIGMFVRFFYSKCAAVLIVSIFRQLKLKLSTQFLALNDEKLVYL